MSPRLYAACRTLASVQISDSAVPPPAVKSPTIGQSRRPTFNLPPSSKPVNSLAAPIPTITSFRPHSNIRPSTMFRWSRTLSAGRSTPRIGTFASVPVDRLGRLMMTNSSGEESGPSGVRATPGASAMTRVLSRMNPLTISLSAPLRRTIAASGEPEAVSVLWKPTPIDSTPTSTATTPAMPNTAAATEPRRCGMLSRPNLLTEATCESQLIGRVIITFFSRHQRHAGASPGGRGRLPPRIRAPRSAPRPSAPRASGKRTGATCRPSDRRAK